MKTICILFLSLAGIVSGISNQDTKTISATFNNYEDGSYYFTDAEEESYEFTEIEEDVLKSFDLTSTKFNGKQFKVTYKEETDVNEDDEEFDILVIVKLEPLD